MLQNLLDYLLPKKFRNRTIILLFTFTFLNGIFFIGPVLIPFFTTWGKLEMTQILILQSIFLFTSAIAEIPTGALGDKVGRKYSLMLGNLSYLIGGILYISNRSFLIFMLAEIFMGIGVAFNSGSTEALEYDTLKEQNKEKLYVLYVSRTRIIKIIGIALGGTIVFILSYVLSPRWIFASAFIIKLFILILLFFIPEPQYHLKNQSLKPNYFSIIKSSLKFMKRSKVLRWVILTSTGFGFVSYFVFWLHQKALLEAGISFKWFGIIEFLVTVFGISYNLVFPELYKKLKYIKFSLFSTIIIFLLVLALLFIKTIPILIASAFIILRGSTSELRFLPRNILNKNIKSTTRATILSFNSLLLTTIQATINPFVGKLADINIWYTILLTTILGLFILIIGLYKLQKVNNNNH